jgi:hypothetical protein
MKSCIFELVVNILTYAIKNKDVCFSQKDFKNVVYTEEFENFDINEKISYGFQYLLKRGFLQLENSKSTFYEKYRLPETLKINTENYTKVFKELSKRIILMHEGKEVINDTYEVKDDYADIIEAVNTVNSELLSIEDRNELKITLCKILVSLNNSKTSKYSLLTIIQLLKLKSPIKIEIVNKNNEFTATNVEFDYIKFNDESIVLYFNSCSIEIDNISSITNIESLDKLSLQEHIEKSLIILEKYNKNKINKIIIFLKSFKF